MIYIGILTIKRSGEEKYSTTQNLVTIEADSRKEAHEKFTKLTKEMGNDDIEKCSLGYLWEVEKVPKIEKFFDSWLTNKIMH